MEGRKNDIQVHIDILDSHLIENEVDSVNIEQRVTFFKEMVQLDHLSQMELAKKAKF